jgi:hypothetical protein
MSGIDDYSRSYVQQWDKAATVRTRSRYRLNADDARHRLFPATLQPIVKHEAIVALGADAVHEILVRTAYEFQGDVASIEVDVVTELCARLAASEVLFDLPQSTRQVALTIATDEVYHAYVAREFIADVERLTGIDPGPPTGLDVPIIKALSYVRKAAPAGLLREAETMALCFAENFVTDALFGMWKDIEPDNPFRTIVREHLSDEGRHQQFFQNLMRHMWAGIGDEAQGALGQLIPGFLDAFLMDVTHQRANALHILGFLGIDRERGEEILDEAYAAAYGPWDGRKYAMKHVAQCLNLVRVAGILDHAPTRGLLIDTGWVAPPA